MKSLSYLLGLAFIPACLSANTNCFSQKLKPSYPCCTSNKVVYTDDDGDWGVENGKWCGIAKEPEVTCFSLALGYPCCKENKTVYTDEDGPWGIENGKWCGIVEEPPDDSCFSLEFGYPCCESCTVAFVDTRGRWGKENKKWCGIKNSCGLAIEDPEETEDPEDVAEGDPNFDLSFLKLENNKKNMLYSPLSIKYALRMLKEGAANNTLAEIENVVGNAELTKYESIDKTLSLANGLFIREKYYQSIKQEFMDILLEKYNAEIKKDPFSSAKNVNDWIEEKTLGIIKNMVPDYIVRDPDTTLLIVNALAMDIKWANPFKNTTTYGDTFYMEDGKPMTATMMHQTETTDKLGFYIDEDITAVTMDLKENNGVQFEFVTLMPTNEKLSTFVENVTKDQIDEIDKKFKSASTELFGVYLSFPKFKFSYDLSLKKDLMELGIKDAFKDDGTADFSNMGNVPLYVSEALHKADIEIEEEGVKAAAVTVFVGGITMASPPIQKIPLYIDINRPFMFVIRDKATKDIWFTGTVYEPNSWENDKDKYFD